VLDNFQYGETIDVNQLKYRYQHLVVIYNIYSTFQNKGGIQATVEDANP
jgi:hypothetical protein